MSLRSSSAPADKTVGAFEDRINYHFRDPSLLLVALTHPSAVDDRSIDTPQDRHYERLEFLGDRVLGLVAAQKLLEHFPDTDEGGLASRLNHIVSRKACTEIGRALDLGDYLILGTSERQSGGARKAAILANACEALIGAIYLDGGLEPVESFFEAFWAERLSQLDQAPRDAKTVLQEWAQARALPIPQYKVVEKMGPDHRPRFRIAVSVRRHEPAEGEGASKKAAEHEAARAFLVREGIWEGAGPHNA